jgi:hypothetical protein
MPHGKVLGYVLTVLSILVILGGAVWRLSAIDSRVSSTELTLERLENRFDQMLLALPMEQRRAAAAAISAPFFEKLSIDKREEFLQLAHDAESENEFRAELGMLLPTAEPADLDLAARGWTSAELTLADQRLNKPLKDLRR